MSSSSTSSRTIDSVPSRFNAPLPSSNPSASRPTTEHKPRPYHPNLRPLPSPHRPHCPAKDRLRLWVPVSPSARTSHPSSPDRISETALNRILEVIGASWADSTKELYGTGLLVFHFHCDLNDISEHERCPVSHTALLAFLSSCAGAYSGSTISNYAAGIRAWHLLHGHPWTVDQNELKLTLQGASRLAPRSSKRPKRPPMTINDIKTIRTFLNLDDPGDIAIYACMVIVFYSVARLGEFTVTAMSKFDPAKHVTRQNVAFLTNQNGLPVIKIALPSTKCAPGGEDVQCAPQKDCVSDPEAALRRHFHINPAPSSAHLFAWRHPKSGLRPLSRTHFISRITSIAKRCGLADLKGHSLRIGGTLFYLLKGIPFDVVKVMGRWAGEAFVLYLRHHALVLAPFLQANQPLLENFNRIAMPPVR
ncbi:hypothetical protein PAXINDRAFT_82964 [Paxillus involutus ATCC 200175]|uniref:Unplaced genomic scaffold PAXINscaffold_42, whole genome shotgun sequence n=1 Tax=Paxillus involutus ATCC 200175 TaxID=664439 RepID=A0A0C9STZ5_PAXIN|nr:hypothetical protein PAXINDRAFT_82964 [Paxillus involutus ATCC 200175]